MWLLPDTEAGNKHRQRVKVSGVWGCWQVGTAMCWRLEGVIVQMHWREETHILGSALPSARYGLWGGSLNHLSLSTFISEPSWSRAGHLWERCWFWNSPLETAQVYGEFKRYRHGFVLLTSVSNQILNSRGRCKVLFHFDQKLKNSPFLQHWLNVNHLEIWGIKKFLAWQFCSCQVVKCRLVVCYDLGSLEGSPWHLEYRIPFWIIANFGNNPSREDT